jgi:histidine triad (HIT) family protein
MPMPASPCIFCKIAHGEIPARTVYRDDEVVAFHDVSPQVGMSALGPDDTGLAGRLVQVANEVAREAGIVANGFRLVVNDGADGGQSVPHLHFHVLGGRQLGWPPG